MRDWTLADWRPHAPRDRLQADAMLVCGEDLDIFAGVLCRLFGDDIREFFLNAAASSGEADFGFFGRGFWIDQPIACNASQPRCGATDVRPSSPAIQFATLRLDHSPPSGGGSRSRSRSFARSPGFRIVADAPLRRRKSPRASGPSAWYRRAIVRSIARRRLSLPTLARWCDRAPKARSPGNPRRGGVVTSHILLFQFLYAQMLADCRHVSPPDSWRLSQSASQARVNPPSTSSQSAGNHITQSFQFS
jgi:hypothetical protein